LEAPFDPSIRANVHAMVIIGADEPNDRDEVYAAIQAKATSHGVTEVAPPQDGDVRPGDNRGREHFGFKDGISQPGIEGLTTSSKTGQDQIAAGEFLIGYSDQDGHVSGEEIPAQPIPPGEPGYPGSTPGVAALPPWTRNGAFVVYRRLRP
jgi:deferrochelatase/peroxidase EfeB